MERSGITIFDEQANPILITSIPTNSKKTHGERLKEIANKILELRIKYPTNTICIERGFTRFNMSTQVIYRVHGLINYLFYDCEQIYYPPKTVKEAILKGNATKTQVRNEIKKKYPDIVFTKIEIKDKKTKEMRIDECEDESDAFAVGLTYFIKNGIIKWDKNIKVKKIN
jgi:Holliday junction resolvasome RuvABC endonuclease subunit